MLKFADLMPLLPDLVKLSNDAALPKYSRHLVYLTRASLHEIETRIIDSIFDNPPKRADIYWLVNFERTDEPYTVEYDVETLVPAKVIRVNLHLGFRIQPRIGIMLRRIAQDMVETGEIPFCGRLKDFKFVILERFLSYDNEFTTRDNFILNAYFSILRMARSDSRAYGIDTDQAVIEKVPLVVTPISKITLKRIERKRH
jgi:KUP system potassium uptake protein